MGWIGRWTRRVVTLLRGDLAHREVEEEMRLHLEMEAEQLMREGLSPRDARREAIRRFGGVDRHREDVREARGIASVQDLAYDARHALRGLARSPGFTAVALLTLALGIGSSTAIFSVVDAVLLRPLPYPEPDRLVRVNASWEGSPVSRLSPAEYLDLRQLEVFDHLGVYAFGSANITGDGEPERLEAAFLSHGLLPALGVPPVIGRSFNAEEDESRARVALVSHALWQRRFGSDPAIVGREIAVDGSAYEVIGVLPGDFSLPEDLVAAGERDLYIPAGIAPTDDLPRGSHFLYGVGRLRAGVSTEAARTAVARAGERMAADYPDDYPREMRFGTGTRSLREDVLGPARPALRLMVGAVAFLLLIACANVANLLLARGEGRGRELSLRRALGAGRGRLFRQLMVESLVLGLAGAVLGALVAAVLVGLLPALRPPDVPRLHDVRLDAVALLFAVALAFVTGLAFGLVPAARAAHGDPAASLRGAGTGGRGSHSGSARLRRALVVAQISAAVILLSGAGLLGRTLMELLRTDPGYRTEDVLTGEITLPSSRYGEHSEVTAFFHRLNDRLRSVPGVVEAGAVSNLPLATSLGDLNFRIEGRPVAEGDVSPRADWQVVTPGYLETMGVDLLRGRSLDERDDAEAPGAVVISRSTAERYWPGGSGLGERFVLGGGAAPGLVTVVGVVADVAHRELGEPPSAQMYLPHAQFRFWNGGDPVRSMDVVLRIEGEAAALAPALRRAVREIDPSLPVASVRTMREVRSASVAQPRLLAFLLGVFAVVALVVATVGVYGVTAYVVGRRTREFGIRMALGAGRLSVVRSALGEGAATVAVGLGLGVGGSLLLGRAVRGMLYQVEPSDPVVLVSTAALLGTAALLASLVPARRATRVDPAAPLRAE